MFVLLWLGCLVSAGVVQGRVLGQVCPWVRSEPDAQLCAVGRVGANRLGQTERRLLE